VTTRPYDVRQLLSGPALSADARKGRALWLQRCAFCHDGLGQPTYRTMGSWLGAETVRLLGPDALRAIIGAGTERMPGFRYTLQPQQVNQLIEFLKTVGPEQKPTPEQLSKKSAGAAATISGD
jgi:mono/diheme cytochrome c family protein